MKEKFLELNLRQSTLAIIRQANIIIEEYQRQGFKLTLRQLYYQFVSRDLLANRQSEYKRLGSILDDGRKAGMIDWAAIEDRTRNLEKLSVWRSPLDILRAVAEQYREDWWLTQPFYPEVWIEKDALTGVIEPVCNEYRVPYFACRGHVSQSEMYDAAQRFKQISRRGRSVIIFHLGDHDPSGVQMTDDNRARLELLSRHADVEVVRLALNYDQIEEYSPPPNPAKDTDSRHGAYAEMMQDHGFDNPDDLPSWELDALNPVVLSDLIRNALDERIEPESWEAARAKEEDSRDGLTDTADKWLNVRRYLKFGESTINSDYDMDATVDEILIDLEETHIADNPESDE